MPVPHAESFKALNAGLAEQCRCRLDDRLRRDTETIGERKRATFSMKVNRTFDSERLGCRSPRAIASATRPLRRAGYPKFFWTMVEPYIDDALRNLRMTQEGQQCIANLYAHVFAEEHLLSTFGPERMAD